MLCTPRKVPAALSSEGGGCGFKLELIFFAFMQKAEVSKRRLQHRAWPGGERDGGKVPREEVGLGYRDPETRESRSQGFAAGKSGRGKGESKQIQKNIDIKTICVEEENMDSKGRVTVVFPKARIIIKKSQLR